MAVEGGKELVTESCVRALPRGAHLVLGPGRIATPAALDLAFQKGIEVRWEESIAPAKTAAAAAGGGLWERMKAVDATYIVVVRNGRVIVSKIGEHGPQAFGEENK